VSEGIAQLFLNLGTRRGCVVSITPRPPLSPGKSRYPLYRRMGGPRSQSGEVRKISTHRDSIPGPSSPWQVAILTTLSRHLTYTVHSPIQQTTHIINMPCMSNPLKCACDNDLADHPAGAESNFSHCV
jgi:hypothetical protein